MVFLRYLLLVSSVVFAVSLAHGASNLPQAESIPIELRILLKEVAYIGTDYPEAVRAGRVHKAEEYQEMIDFSASAQKQFKLIKEKIPEKDQRDIEHGLTKLQSFIDKKSHHNDILDITQTLTRQITLAFAVPVAPESSPLLALGRHIYQSQCASCHGVSGQGDGPAGQNLDPAPRDFHEESVMKISSPFKFYNILLTGIEGTGMASYADILTEEELWSTAFYLSGLRYENDFSGSAIGGSRDAELMWNQLTAVEKNTIKRSGLSKSLLASTDDAGLLTWLKDKQIVNQEQAEAKWLAFLRFSAPYLAEIPLGSDAQLSTSHKLDLVSEGIHSALSSIRQSKELFHAGDMHGAEQELLKAYLFGFEKTEVNLSLVDKSIVTDVEQKFMAARSYAEAGDASQFSDTINSLEIRLNSGLDTYLQSQKIEEKTPWTDFAASFVIIVREGFEAFLVVAALLALLGGMGENSAKRWVHAGWLSAILLGFASYFAFTMLIQLSGAAKETIEAVCTGIAVIMLFYTGFWLLSQAEQQRWNRFVKERTRSALSSGRLLGLFSISFIAVYREAAETVLFYSALYSTAGSHLAVTFGFLFGCLILFAVCAGMIRYNLKLPLRQFFMTTSCLMVVISIILAGKTVHELIEAGFFLSTPLSGFPSIDLLGIYPSVETITAQALLLVSGLSIAYFMMRNRRIASET